MNLPETWLFPLHAQAPIYKPPSLTLPPRSARRVDINIKQPKRWPTAGACHLEPVLSLCSFSSSSLITFQESRLLHWMWFWWAGRSRLWAPTVGSGGESLPSQSQYREDTGLGLCWASWEHPPWQHTHQDRNHSSQPPWKFALVPTGWFDESDFTVSYWFCEPLMSFQHIFPFS